jgi:4-diphosphocytidyl-2-C-methyl-D-erythritol kinase
LAFQSNMAIREPAPAKVNLALHVRRRRADGYHDLETVFAFARDGEGVEVELADEDDFAVTGPFAAALAGEGDNLVLRAARAFTERFAPGAAHAITLDKHLPVASGVGGGSADAAATLRALAHLHRIEDAGGLREIARGLGADVPACLLGRTCFGTGKGDDLTELPPLGDVPALLVNPRVAVATAPVFAGWDGIDRGALDPANWRRGRNDLETPARALAPAIGAVLEMLAAQSGVTLSRMSGSGATCFALFADAGARDAAAAAVGRDQPGWWMVATALA